MPPTMKRTTHPNPLDDATPTPRDVELMALVLEGRHGVYAAEIAEFFSNIHDNEGDVSRSWAWAGVASLVRKREHARLFIQN